MKHRSKLRFIQHSTQRSSFAKISCWAAPLKRRRSKQHDQRKTSSQKLVTPQYPEDISTTDYGRESLDSTISHVNSTNIHKSFCFLF